MTTVLCAGVAVVDLVLQVDQIPPGQTSTDARAASIVGGGCAANAAVAVSRLGGRSYLLSRLGADPVGDMVVAGLVAEQVNCDFADRHPGHKSSYSSVLLDADGDRQILNYRDWSLPVTPNWRPDSLPRFDSLLVDTRWPEGSLALLEQAAGKPAVIDAEAPLGEALLLFEHATHIAFSAQGLREYLAQIGHEVVEIPAALQIANDHLSAIAIVTDGAAGVYWEADGKLRNLPAFEIDAVDTLGAGDIWHGAFALALGEGQDLDQALVFASAAAALKCARFGGRKGTPTREEVETFLAANPIEIIVD